MVWLVFFLGPMAGNQDAPIDPYNWPIQKSEIIFLLLQPLTTKERFVRAPVNKTIETKKLRLLYKYVLVTDLIQFLKELQSDSCSFRT